MAHHAGLNRRSFLKSAGLTALAGAVAGQPAVATAGGAVVPPETGRFDFDTVYNRFGSDCVKYDQQIRVYGKDSVEVGMGIADMDFKAAPSITEALRERLGHENWGYLDMTAATEEMVSEVIAWNKRRYNIAIDPASMTLSTGVHPALIATLRTFSPPGSKVLLQTPTYNGFYTDLRWSDTVAEESPMTVDAAGRYSMDFEDFERRIGPDTHTFILCNPQNPTGNCWSAEDLTRIGEICLRRRVIVLADEIHCDFVNKGQTYTPFASLPNKAIVDNSLTFKAASKSFSLAAHKCAWFYSTNPDLMKRVRANLRSDLTTLGIVANIGAYRGGDEWLNQLRVYIDGNHDFAAQYIKANIPMIKFVKPEGTYLAWLDVTAVADKIGAKKLAEEANRKLAPGAAPVTPETMVERHLVQHARVHLNQGRSYGVGGDNHMRMNLATSRKQIEKALSNIARALNT